MKEQLSHMRDKLNNINKRNRSIRLLKVYQKWSFDIAMLDTLEEHEGAQTVLRKIVDPNTKGKVTLLKPSLDNEKSMSLSKRLTDLYRQIKALEDETGVHDLYLGYPFLSGVLLDGTFIQAPLFLFPIRLERENTGLQKWIVHNEEGGPQLNRTLFLALKKLNKLGFSEDIFEEAVSAAGSLNFEEIAAFLGKHQLKVHYTRTGLSRLREYKSGDMPEMANMTLLENAVIGDFPQGGSAIVRDYEELIQLSETDALSLVGDMISSEDALPIEAGAWLNPSESDEQVRNKEEIFNLLQTDGSQEEILKEARYLKGLVVHGPPGTGKSQVIVNLITDALHRKKKVLVVCQKRAALDVVYQRMDSLSLSDHVALVHDEKVDRNTLYQKITRVLEHSELKFVEAVEELFNVTSRVNYQEQLLNTIAQALNERQPFGYRLYELYGESKPVTDSNQIITLNSAAEQLTRESLREMSEAVYTYGEWYQQFGQDTYPLRHRNSFAALDMKAKLEVIEKIELLIRKAKDAVAYIETLDIDKITPAYTWLVHHKLNKIYPDLDDNQKRTLQGLRLFWWTTFTGKSIIEEITGGEKFKGTSSAEWIGIKEALKIMHNLAVVTEALSSEITTLNLILQDKQVRELQSRIADGDIPLNELITILDYIYRDFDDLKLMDSFWEQASSDLKSVIQALQEKGLESEQPLPQLWVDILKNSAYIYWIDQIEAKYPEVQKISTNEFGRIRESFANLLEEKRKAAAKYLIHELRSQVGHLQQMQGRSTKELKHQTGKKRMIWPLRKLVNDFADKGLVDIMPVWLASPEMVSSIFPLKEGLFDIVIFDEASQLTVESGIPAVYRGKQIVIAGDEKQLPPSNLFRAGYADEEDEEEARYDTDESISLLNLAKRRFPEKILQWHYRSKYEELINFSNHAFYNGYVQIAPNVTPFQEPPAIIWKRVEGRWLNQSNEVEALEVVTELKGIMENCVGKSVGIITFNSKQQSKILDIIDKMNAEDEEFRLLYTELMARDLDERLFVKNIENVQGDERDIILFSIGYAKNEEGKVYNRFGSLNQKGGENRLNVAVTRAKEKVLVVSSIEPEDLNVSNTSERGPKLLKSYLKYARAVSSGKMEAIRSVILDLNEVVNTHAVPQSLHFDSPFEEQVYQQLRNLGYEITTQVGMSGYRIDMAVVHPNDHSRFILGIECDGAMYHSSPSARERDVYRQRYLESRGWTIERIWSRNWWRNPVNEIERIDQRIKELIREEEVRERVEVL
ncbi:AAA domain-containing protein [Paenibacillus sp. YPG26]|uniref:AAA domain-containing protein n=1 Tax=Paenibacillus sp. YPG26 TaxID=2878915 RepID=UPI00203A802F|nr:AAA domain-containing protein [Paenibacillus sp. YPG26]USB33204.1 AAA domain-containing protein [Paenibacillus sp. YPG26]